MPVSCLSVLKIHMRIAVSSVCSGVSLVKVCSTTTRRGVCGGVCYLENAAKIHTESGIVPDALASSHLSHDDAIFQAITERFLIRKKMNSLPPPLPPLPSLASVCSVLI